jgi:uncharacterized membrane protein
MTTILIIIIYFLMGYIVGTKQYKASCKSENVSEYPEVNTIFAALLWPIFLIWYIIRAVFFEDWI